MPPRVRCRDVVYFGTSEGHFRDHEKGKSFWRISIWEKVINVQGEGSFFAVPSERRDLRRKNAARKNLAGLPDRLRQ